MTQPSDELYRQLLAVLRATTKAFDAADDDAVRLENCLEALRAVAEYLHWDADVLGEMLTKPINAMLGAAWDAGRGATVALLQHKPDRIGKPTDVMRQRVQGVIARAMDLLVWSDMRPADAADWVAAVARDLKVRCEDGAPISARQITRWRSEITSGNSAAAARDTFDKFLHTEPYAEMLTKPKSETKREKCKILARRLVGSIAGMAPQSAPKQIRQG